VRVFFNAHVFFNVVPPVLLRPNPQILHILPFLLLPSKTTIINTHSLLVQYLPTVLNGLPKTWDAFAASMNTRKEYPTFEEIWTFCAQEESRINAKEKSQNKYDDQAFTTKFKNFRNKKNFGSRKKPNQEKDMSKIQCFNCRKYGHYRNQYPELKKRKETNEATVVEEREPSKKVKWDKTYFFF
jgi:hypothetical protein